MFVIYMWGCEVTAFTSSESKDHPPKHAIMVRRSRVVRSRIQANIVTSSRTSDGCQE